MIRNKLCTLVQQITCFASCKIYWNPGRTPQKEIIFRRVQKNIERFWFGIRWKIYF